jgi:hypothetical protein
VARFALLLALASGLGPRAVRAQDTTRVAGQDSIGLFSRVQLRRFLLGAPRLQPVAAPQAYWRTPGPQSTARIAAAFDSGVTRTLAGIAADSARRRTLHQAYSFARDTMTSDSRRGLFGLSPNTADISFDGSLRFQLSTSRQRNLACTPALVLNPSSGCSGGFTAPRIDNVVQLASSGTFLQRYHVNVDFQSTRDYSAGNVVNAYYQGLMDEKLQRVDIGTQIFRPPPSRFLTASIPTNNFGIGATAVFGPVTVQAIAATQKGSVVNAKHFTIGAGTQQPQDKLTRDLDYEAGRAFWVVDPRTLAGYPALDILDAGRIPVTAGERPNEVRVYRYIAANGNVGANANYDGITAHGFNGFERTGAVRWRLLKQNIDYWIDPSGLWFVLAGGRIDPNDYLAVSYRKTNGDSVGSFPAVDNPAADDSLQLIYLPNRGPASTVFPFEMRQVYHVGGASVVLSSLRATILVANSERPDGGAGTYLSLLGLANQAEAAILDVDNRVFPRTRDPGASQVVKDRLLIFPNAQPFASTVLTPAVRNDSLYVTPEYLLFTQGPASKFTIRLQFDAQGGDDNSNIRLDAVDITEGTEKLELNGRTLVRNRDYTIDYNTGRVDFLDPNGLFGTGVSTLNATYEQRGFFAQAPTTIAGLTATWTLGRFKTLSVAGLYQAESSGYTRPQIGYEARSSLLAGIVGDFDFNAPSITRLLNRIVRKPSTAPSDIHFAGEFALSHPDPNRSGAAYLEEFENDRSLLIRASQNAWGYGSVPTSAAGLQNILPQGFDSAAAVQLIVQNLVPNAHDSITQVSAHDIDPSIALTASKIPQVEPVLWMTQHADTSGGLVDFTSRSHWTLPERRGFPRWRTIQTPLSATGVDLSRNDYFQFALYETSDKPIETSRMRIVMDLGRVSEDALSIAPDSFHVLKAGDVIPPRFAIGDTIYTGRQYVGVHHLDSERTFFGTWDATVDDIGILADRPDSIIGPDGTVIRRPALCADSLSSVIHFVPWGDLSARCSNHNGVPDTEDLDGDNLLDAQGAQDAVFRYVVDLGADSAKYFVRSHVITDPVTGLPLLDRFGRSARWTIYRVPLREANDTIGTPDIHLVKQMRIAFVTPDNGGVDSTIRFAMSMMQLTGAAWVGRADRPIVSLSGTATPLRGSVVVGTVSTQDSVELGYTSPPGIGNATSTVTNSNTQLAQQINEKALRIQVTDLEPGERAEAYTRLPSGARNLLAYRELRVWMRGRPGTAGWNGGPLQAYVKVGSDAYNFYLYRAPAQTATWEPEMVIDLQTWQDLRSQIENVRLRGGLPNGGTQCGGGDSTAYVACSADGSYFVQVRDPQINPPNLAAVQELAAGIYYSGTTGLPISQTELWVDDIRVSRPVSTTGIAGAMSARLVASDVGTFEVSGLYQSGQFHQMSQSPTYQNAASLVAVTSLRLEKFLPPRLGLIVPVNISSNWGWVDPELLSGSDVRAAGLDQLRRPRSDATTWSVSIRDPLRPGSAHLTKLVLHPLSFTATGSAASNTTSLSDLTSSAWATSLGYALSPQRRTYRMGLGGLTRGLPRWLRESAGGQGLARASFAPVPTQLQFTSTVSHTIADLQTYQEPVRVLADTILRPVNSEQFLWRNTGSVTWQPFTMLSMNSSLASTRDLREYPDSTTLGRVANASHHSLLGTDVGVERDRNLTNSMRVAPRFAAWLGSDLTVGTNFFLSRSLTTRNPVRIEGDTAGAYILPQTLSNSRFIEFHFSVEPHLLAARIFGDTTRLAKSLVRFRPIEITRRHTLESTFDLATFNPGLGYQFALGNLNSFLRRDGQNAIGAADAMTTNVSTSMDFPGGLSAQLSYESTDADRYQQNSTEGFLKTNGSTKAWPSGRFNWSRTFAHGPISRLSGGSSIRQERASSTNDFGGEAPSLSVSETRRISPTLDLIFRNGLTATITGETDNTEGTSSGNLTQVKQLNLVGVVSWSMRLPQLLSAARRSLQTSITVTQNSNSSCIQRTGDSTCVPYYDLRRLDVRTSFAATLEHAIQTGLALSYTHNSVRSQGLRLATINISVFLSVPLSGWGM